MQRKPDPIKSCAHCGNALSRKRHPSGRLEGLREFHARKHCDATCHARSILAGPATHGTELIYPNNHDPGMGETVDFTPCSDSAGRDIARPESLQTAVFPEMPAELPKSVDPRGILPPGAKTGKKMSWKNRHALTQAAP